MRNRVVTDRQVAEIRQHWTKGEQVKELAKRYDLSVRTISRIINGGGRFSKPRPTRDLSLSGIVVKDIPGYPGYRADSEGHIWGKRGRRLKWQYDKKGYPRITVSRDNKQHVHKLICIAFHGPRPDGLECRHLDGNKKNSNPDNLVWGTQAENQADARLHGADIIGAKLNYAKVGKIRELSKQGLTINELAEIYGVTPSNISHILRGITWRHDPRGE